MGVRLPARASRRPPVRGVLLDVFDTLFSPARLGPAFAACGIDPTLVPLWISLIFGSGIALTAAQDYRRFHDVAINTLIGLDSAHIGRGEAQAIVRVLQQLEPYPDVGPGLALLRAAGVRVLTLTQMEAGSCEALFARAGLRDMVDGFLSVDAVRRWKPAPEAYAYGAAQVGWPPAEVALISAHGWDVHGARRADLQTGHILRQRPTSSPAFDPGHVAGNDLPSVVEQLLDPQ